MPKLTHTQTQALIDKLVVQAERLELEAVAKSHIKPDTPRKEQRMVEGITARMAALITREQIRELTATLHT